MRMRSDRLSPSMVSSIMQSPSWEPRCVRSLASPCCARRLAAGNLPGYCNYDVRVGDAGRRGVT